MKLKNPNCSFVIPTVFDDSLSYYEAICKLYKYVEEAISYIKEYEQNYKEYTDNKIKEIDLTITEKLNNTINQLNSQYSQFSNLVINNLNIYSKELELIKKDIDNKMLYIEQRTSLMIEQNNEYILSKIGEGLVSIKVLNGFTGEYVTIQSMFDYLVSLHAENSMTYTQLVNKNKSYTELKNANITFTQLFRNGNILI